MKLNINISYITLVKNFGLKKSKGTDKKKILDTRSKDETEKHDVKEEELESTLLDEDVKKLLVITDNLLGELPEEVIDKFAQSEDFELYSKVFQKYKIK